MIPRIAHLDPLMRIVEDDEQELRDPGEGGETDRSVRPRDERDPPPRTPGKPEQAQAGS